MDGITMGLRAGGDTGPYRVRWTMGWQGRRGRRPPRQYQENIVGDDVLIVPSSSLHNPGSFPRRVCIYLPGKDVLP